MSPDQLLSGPPVTMTNAQPMRQPEHSERAEAFQLSLQYSNVKTKDVTFGSKQCKRCSKTKDFCEFRINITTTDGRRGKCKQCENEIEKARYHKKKAV